VSFERLGDFYLRRGEGGDAERALAAYQKSLETRQRLYDQNPNDAQAARDLIVSHYKLAYYAEQSQNGQAMQRHLRDCRRILHHMVDRGIVLDDSLHQLMERLDAEGSKS
jgi:site-specific recombinase XerD